LNSASVEVSEPLGEDASTELSAPVAESATFCDMAAEFCSPGAAPSTPVFETNWAIAHAIATVVRSLTTTAPPAVSTAAMVARAAFGCAGSGGATARMYETPFVGGCG
jgi:hypothetical protein